MKFILKYPQTSGMGALDMPACTEVIPDHTDDGRLAEQFNRLGKQREIVLRSLWTKSLWSSKVRQHA
ncbi:MAG: hypothetical protein ACLRMZ_08360 [Blautia marasmi]